MKEMRDKNGEREKKIAILERIYQGNYRSKV